MCDYRVRCVCVFWLTCLLSQGALLAYYFLLQFFEFVVQAADGGFTPQNLRDRILLFCLEGLQMLFMTKKLFPALAQMDIQLLEQRTGENMVA